jgi:hypothetical protein
MFTSTQCPHPTTPTGNEFCVTCVWLYARGQWGVLLAASQS